MKTAIITGGGSGIGRAAAELLSREGFRVGLVGRSPQPLEAAAAAVRDAGGEAWAGALDVRERSAVDAFASAAAARFGGIDLLVNNAGVFRTSPFEKMEAELWDQVLGINLTGAYNFARAVWHHISGGQIINVSSIAGVKPFPGNAAYCASKYGLIGLSEVLALEGRSRSIRVHTLAPGNTDTPAWDGGASDNVRERMMRPEQVAEAIRWLAVSPPEVTFQTLVMLPVQDPWKLKS